MPRRRSHQQFTAKLNIHLLGPIRPRTKYKENKLASDEAKIRLPFVPFPGLFMRMHQRRRTGMEDSLYLRIRSVEWCMPEEQFECTVDEILGDPCFRESLGSERLASLRGGVRENAVHATKVRVLSDRECARPWPCRSLRRWTLD